MKSKTYLEIEVDIPEGHLNVETDKVSKYLLEVSTTLAIQKVIKTAVTPAFGEMKITGTTIIK